MAKKTPTLRSRIIEDAAIEAVRNGWDVVDVLGSERYYRRLLKVYGYDEEFDDLAITSGQEKKLLSDARRAVKEFSFLGKNEIPSYVLDTFDRVRKES